MSLVPVRSFSGSLPVVFIEARLDGPPRVAFAQLGLSLDVEQCNLGILTRTSGVLLVASVGSYMVYRICTRFLGRSFLWAIFDRANMCSLAHNETRLLRADAGHVHDDSDESELADDELSPPCFCHCSPRTTSRSHSRVYLRLQKLRRSSRIPRQRMCAVGDTGRICADAADTSGLCSDRGNATIISSSSNGSQRSSSPTSTEKSASLRLIWDDPQWDEQADLGLCDHLSLPVDKCNFGSPTATNVSDMSVFREALDVLEDDTASISGSKERKLDDLESRSVSGDASDSIAQAHEFIEKNCLNDSQHFYRITGYVTTSDGMSLSSERSARSFMSLKQKLAEQEAVCGLLELTAREPFSSSTENIFSSMTDSGISKGTVSTINLPPNNRPITVDVSANSEGLLDEDALNVSAHHLDHPLKNAVIKRTSLSHIAESLCSPSTSRCSEWFEDDCCSLSSSETATQRLLAQYFQADSSVGGQMTARNDVAPRRHLLKYSRDLVAWARERLASENLQDKVLQILYTKHRWRRIGVKRSTSFSDHIAASLVHAMHAKNVPFFVGADVSALFEAVKRIFSLYEFARQWHFPDVLALQKGDIAAKEEVATRTLTVLWDVQNGMRLLEDGETERYCMEGIRLLALVWITHLFEKVESHGSVNQFYKGLFGRRNPRQLTKCLRDGPYGADELRVLADALRLRLRVVNCVGDVLNELPQMGMPHAKDSATLLTFLKPVSTDDFIYPLYHNS